MTRFGRRVYRIVSLPQQRRFLLSDSIDTRAEGLPIVVQQCRLWWLVNEICYCQTALFSYCCLVCAFIGRPFMRLKFC